MVPATTAALPQGNQVALSKALSKLLRHDAAQKGLQLDSAGYASLQQILQFREIARLGATEELIDTVVKNCPKQRFGLVSAGEQKFIRCNQGHSGQTAAAIENCNLLRPISSSEAQQKFPRVMHGTYERHLESILKSGLSRGTRRHIHLTPFQPNEKSVMSGFRSSCEILIHVDMAQALLNGIPFWMSSNQVILTEGDASGCIPAQYISRVEYRPRT